MQRILVFLLSIGLASLSNSQALLPGSIAFLSYQTNAPDGFAFVTLQEVPPVTSIYFTDNGWSGSSFFSGEETMQWTSPVTTLPAGTVVTVRDISGTQQLIGPGLISGGLPNLSSSGDQVLAYTGSASSPNFIAGITNSSWLSICASTTQPNVTCLPSPLVNGQTAQSPVNSETVVTNMYFNIGEFSGTPDQIRAALMNWGNWTISNDIGVAGYTAWPDWEFTVQAPAPLNLSVDNSNLLLNEGAIGSSIEFVLDGPAYGNQRVGFIASGMISSGDVSSIPSFLNDTLWIEFASGSNAAVLDIAAVEDLSPEGTENGFLSPVFFTSGIVSNNNAISITIEELQGISLVQFTTESQTLTEGDSLLVNFSITPPALENSSFTIELGAGLMLEPQEYTCANQIGLNNYTVEIEAGEAEVSVWIKITADDFPEASEVLSLYISEAGLGMLVGGNSEIELIVPENDQEFIPTGLYLNEVMANNDSTILDENGFYSDWVEVYNAGGGVLNLEGLYISDDALNPYKFKFSDVNLLPGSFTLFWADDSTELGNTHLNFRLSASGEQLFLFAAADEPVMIDSMNVPALAADQSYGSPQNGNQNRQIFEAGLSTPAASNSLSSTERLYSNTILNLYPNPVVAGAQVRVDLTTEKPSELCIFDTNGKLVFTSKTSTFSMPLLDAGVYFIRLSDSFKTTHAKIVVQ